MITGWIIACSLLALDAAEIEQSYMTIAKVLQQKH